MAGLSSSRTEHHNGGRGSGILVWTLLIVLAVGATGVLVLSNDARLLRLAIVGALWAALIGAFIAASYRRSVAQRDQSAARLRQVYELELEREVAARREYELELETETRRRVAEEARAEAAADLAALRNEMRAMRENLESLLGGELLVERVALRAEHTRMRSIGEQSHRMLSAAREGRQRGIVAGAIGSALNGGTPSNGAPQAAAADPKTELIGTVGADWEAQLREPARPERRMEQRPVRNEPVRPERNRREPAEQRPQGHAASRQVPKPEQPPSVAAASSRNNLPVTPSRRDLAAPSRTNLPAASSRVDLPGAARAGRRPAAEPEPAEQSWPAQSWEQADRRTGAYTDRQPLGARRDPSRQDLPQVAAPPRVSQARRIERPPREHAAEQPSSRGMPPVPPPVVEEAGAHASGRSVSDLLAAHGNAEPPRRRRRRAED